MPAETKDPAVPTTESAAPEPAAPESSATTGPPAGFVASSDTTLAPAGFVASSDAALAPEVIVYGGTLSSRSTNEIRRFEHESNVRRAHQDQQQQIAGSAKGSHEVASFRSRRLISQDSPRLVLYYKKHDQYCLSEITTVAKPDGVGMEMMFTLVCTRCLERGLPQGQAQLQVRESNRRFSIDDSKRGPKRVESAGVVQLVQQCGTVTVEEKVRCTACGWSVRIVDSKVEEV